MSMYVALLLSATVGIVTSYPTGPPPAASICQSMVPNHGQSRLAGKPYTIVAPDTFQSGQPVQIKINNPSNPGSKYAGVFIQVRNVENSDSRDDIVGNWLKPANTNFRLYSCNRQYEAAAVCHANRKPKTVMADTFEWRTAMCENGKDYYIRATVVQSFDKYQVGLEKKITCVNPVDQEPDPGPPPTIFGTPLTPETGAPQTATTKAVPTVDHSDREAMEAIKPKNPQHFCKNKWAIIPKGSSTSFETGFDGWRNMFPAPHALMRISGPTPSETTGPNQASDGDWYVYLESSKLWNLASGAIVSPHGLRGCFCFVFDYHMNTDSIAKVEVFVKGVKRFHFFGTKRRWARKYMMITDEEDVWITIVANRGMSANADIGIDNIHITPGECPKRRNPSQLPG